MQTGRRREAACQTVHKERIISWSYWKREACVWRCLRDWCSCLWLSMYVCGGHLKTIRHRCTTVTNCQSFFGYFTKHSSRFFFFHFSARLFPTQRTAAHSWTKRCIAACVCCITYLYLYIFLHFCFVSLSTRTHWQCTSDTLCHFRAFVFVRKFNSYNTPP